MPVNFKMVANRTYWRSFSKRRAHYCILDDICDPLKRKRTSELSGGSYGSSIPVKPTKQRITQIDKWIFERSDYKVEGCPSQLGWPEHNFWLWGRVMDAAKERCNQDHMNLIVNLLRQIWRSRNAIQFRNERKNPVTSINKSIGEWNEYDQVQKNVEDLAEHKACCATREVLWKPPLEGTVMMNTDAALQVKKNRSGRGIPAWNHEWRETIGDLGWTWGKILWPHCGGKP